MSRMPSEKVLLNEYLPHKILDEVYVCRNAWKTHLELYRKHYLLWWPPFFRRPFENFDSSMTFGCLMQTDEVRLLIQF